MSIRAVILNAIVMAVVACPVGMAQQANKAAACKRAVIEGELNAGQAFSQAIGGGLKVFFQPIASGWILRVVPVAGLVVEPDYAEVATPPYQSVTPLSVSTDFAFRAQDAVGWNPRRFHFATSTASFHRLEQIYESLHAQVAKGGSPAPELEAGLGDELRQTAPGTFTILDAKLVAGTADQWQAAAAVASHFSTTAHTLVAESDGHTSPLGRLVWVRFRMELDLPNGFAINSALRLEPRACESRQ